MDERQCVCETGCASVVVRFSYGYLISPEDRTFGVILWLMLNGSVGQFLGLLALLMLLQVLLSLLAIRIEDDDLWLARYAPLSIIGYKQFLDTVLFKKRPRRRLAGRSRMDGSRQDQTAGGCLISRQQR